MLTHNGSNNLNFASIWLAPAKNLAYLAATNIAGEGGETASDQAIQAMIQESMEKEKEDRAPGHDRLPVKSLFQDEEKKIRNDSSVITPRMPRKG